MNTSRHQQSEKIVSLLTQGSILKSILSIAIPMIISNLFGIALELTDAFFVGKLGSDALAAVSLGSVVIFFLATFGVGLGFGIVALISRSFGERNFDEADRVVIQSFYLGIIISLAIGIIGFLASPKILELLGAEGNVLATGMSYLKILFAGIITMFFMFLSNAVFQGIGDTTTPMKIWGFSVILNIILDPIMIFGMLGFPRLGVSGAALATVISRTIGSILMVYMLLHGKKLIHISKKHLPVNLEIIKKIFNIGLPGSIQMLLRSFSMIVLIKITALFGTVVVAAYGVGGRLFHVFLFPGFGLGGATATLSGQNLGAKNPKRAVNIAMISTIIYLGFLLISGTIVFIFAKEIAALFNPEPEFINIASIFFRYLAVGSLFLSTSIILSRALQGAGNTVKPMIVTALTLYILQIPLALILSNHMGMKEIGIWMAGLAGTAIHGIIMLFVFFTSKEFEVEDNE
ncbi:MAG: MATE family efflux transporter [Endomicrobiales bacterium]|nr:MATE family efflux transporter [Endomicrobiales bacterium]